MGLETFALEPQPLALDYMLASYVPLQVSVFGRGIGTQFVSWIIRAIGKGMDAARTLNFDLVYATNNNLFNLLTGLWIARRLRLPCVVVVHHLRWVDYRDHGEGQLKGNLDPSRFLQSLRNEGASISMSLTRVIGGYVESKILPRFDMFIVTSRTVAKQLSTLVPADRISVVENAPFKTRHSEESLQGRGMTALSVGRIDEGKGVQELLRVWEQVVLDFPIAHLEIAGEGSLRNRMISEVRNRGLDRHVRFPGFLNDNEIVKLQSESRFFITLSRTEGFGMAIAEALAAGLPVVAWDIPPFREIFGACEAVFLCPQGDVKHVISSSANLLRIPKDKWDELSAQASDFSRRFSWSEAAKKELNVFEKAREELQSSN